MGGVKRVTKPRKLKPSKKKQEPPRRAPKPSKAAKPVKEAAEKKTELPKQKGPIKVQSTRTNAPATFRPATQAAPKERPAGPGRIAAPGPSIRERAAAKAKTAAKGTKNKSTVKVAQSLPDLESDSPSFVSTISDVPRPRGMKKY